jgi:hypothetical protein
MFFLSAAPFDITVKSAFELEEVTLSSSGEEICRIVCKSPLYDVQFELERANNFGAIAFHLLLLKSNK